jgi:plasmid stability protein
MATLYVENVPKELYEALRSRARARRRSIAAEVLALLEENVPTAQELKARQDLLRKLVRMRAKQTNFSRAFPSTEEMLREDRQR